jgi:hypothetical protein
MHDRRLQAFGEGDDLIVCAGASRPAQQSNAAIGVS